MKLCLVWLSILLLFAGRANAENNTLPESFISLQTERLEKVRKHYQELVAAGGWQKWEEGDRIKPGDSDERVAVLYDILRKTGDYKVKDQTETDEYAPDLVKAVRQFQLRHGLNADGTLGKSTQAALAVPAEKRLLQVTVTLQRLRENAMPPEDKFILVNLPAYRLYAMEHGKTALEMRVIVGNRQNHTPIFDNTVTDVVFNPSWHVPAKIVRNEMLPKLAHNPAYFIKAGFVVTQDGAPVDPLTINPYSGNLKFRQLAGKSNALGKIKFNIPDSDDIYLHSTASPQLFAKEFRALSHGCIRLEKPRELAYFVMQEEQLDKEKIDGFYDDSRERHIVVNEVPVHIVYWTAFADESGTVYFYDDVYNKDQAIEVKLNAHDTIAVAKSG